MPQIEVTFDIDANGILHVTAKDLGTGKEQKITITASSGLNDSEVQKMVKDAQQYAQDDKKRRESAETRNMAENLAYQTEKLLKEQGDKIASDKKSKVDSAVSALKDAIKGGKTEEMKSRMEELNAAMQAVSSDLYSQAKTRRGATADAGKAPEGGDGSGKEDATSAKKKDGDVIDADFEMVDDQKK